MILRATEGEGFNSSLHFPAEDFLQHIEPRLDLSNSEIPAWEVLLLPFTEEMRKNRWLREATMIAVNIEPGDKLLAGNVHCHFYFCKKSKNRDLVWLMLHEYRHHMQMYDPNVGGAVWNENRNILLRDLCGKGFEKNKKVLDAVKHVYHEVDPAEVDANVFACELMGIPYKANKWTITPATKAWLTRIRTEEGFRREGMRCRRMR